MINNRNRTLTRIASIGFAVTTSIFIFVVVTLTAIVIMALASIH